MNKIMNISEAVDLIKDGMTISIGGNVLHRSPNAFLREIVRHKKRNLRIVKTAGAHDVDLLVAGNCVQSVDAGFIGYETEFGLASFYRKACEKGEIKVNEHACYTVMSALNAARINAPFMPVRGLVNSDLILRNDYFMVIKDPFSGEDITVVKAINPDYAIIHVHECDKEGNGIIKGAAYDDVLLAKSATNVILTTEKIVSKTKTKLNFKEVKIPGLLVKAVVKVSGGAKPCSCDGLYDIDRAKIKDFLKIENELDLNQFLKGYEKIDQRNQVVGD